MTQSNSQRIADLRARIAAGTYDEHGTRFDIARDRLVERLLTDDEQRQMEADAPRELTLGNLPEAYRAGHEEG